jgi:uncharacterized membrane protein YcaP (DUF421 family)
MTSVLAAAVVAVLLLLVVIVDLLHSHGRVLRRLHELDPVVETEDGESQFSPQS